MLLSILIPVFNEAESIEKVLLELNEISISGVDFEIIVVNDGSTDGTREVLGNLDMLYGTVIHSERNAGKGDAVIRGLEAATGEFVLVQDADLEYHPRDIEKLLRPIRDFSADLVMGSRFLSPEVRRVGYYWHRIGNSMITGIFNVLNNSLFSDIYTGYIVFRRSLLQASELKRLGWDQQAEILSLIYPRVKAAYEVAIAYHPRSYLEGKKIRPHHIFRVVITMITLRIFRRG